MRYAKIFLEQCKLSVMSAAMFRANFWLTLIQSFANTAMNLLCMEFIYGSVDSIAGWNKHEMLILLCTAMIVNQLFRGAVHWNQNRFIAAIGDGGLDKMLMRPVSLIFQANTGSIDISGLLSNSAPLVVLIVQASALGVHVSAARLTLYVLLVLNGVFTLSAFMLLLFSSAFVFIKADGLGSVYYQMMDIADKPRDMFPRQIWLALTLIIPAIPLANAPASVLLGRGDWRYLLAHLGTGALFGAAAYAAMRLGLRRYSSASS